MIYQVNISNHICQWLCTTLAKFRKLLIISTALVVFVGASALLVIEAGKRSEYKEKIANADIQLKTLISLESAPTTRNLEAARKNFDALNSKLRGIYENLRSGSILETYTNNARVVSAIQKYIINYQEHLAF